MERFEPIGAWDVFGDGCRLRTLTCNKDSVCVSWKREKTTDSYEPWTIARMESIGSNKFQIFIHSVTPRSKALVPMIVQRKQVLSFNHNSDGSWRREMELDAIYGLQGELLKTNKLLPPRTYKRCGPNWDYAADISTRFPNVSASTVYSPYDEEGVFEREYFYWRHRSIHHLDGKHSLISLFEDCNLEALSNVERIPRRCTDMVFSFFEITGDDHLSTIELILALTAVTSERNHTIHKALAAAGKDNTGPLLEEYVRPLPLIHILGAMVPKSGLRDGVSGTSTFNQFISKEDFMMNTDGIGASKRLEKKVRLLTEFHKKLFSIIDEENL